MKRRRHSGTRGFTLVEVILAVAISLGLMLVVLFFYQQATQLREEVLSETERVRVVRRVMDRLTEELRTAVPHEWLPAGMVGDSNYVMFARSEVPGLESWDAEAARSDLRVISYGLAVTGVTNQVFGGEEVAGVTRTEEPLLRALWEYALEEETSDSADGEESSVAEQWADEGAALLTDQIRHLRFRYWNGWWWQDVWERLDLPVGVEITLGLEAWPVGAEEYPHEVFRRVVYLPSNEAPDALAVFDLIDPFEGDLTGEEEEVP